MPVCIILLLFLQSMLNKRTFTIPFIIVACLSLGAPLKAQEKITFIATDKLIVTGDLYMVNDTLPYMILCPKGKSSRGEYRESAKKFMKLGYNCIAVDLRNGGSYNGVEDETATLASLKHLPSGMLDSKIDIEAAIAYAYNRSNKKVVLVGSGYSASLVLYIGATDSRVATVLAFSPSDYFNGKLNINSVLPKYNIPVYVSSARSEAGAVKKYVADIPSSKLVQFIPPTEGASGSPALLTSDRDEYHDYWISILMFMRQVQP